MTWLGSFFRFVQEDEDLFDAMHSWGSEDGWGVSCFRLVGEEDAANGCGFDDEDAGGEPAEDALKCC